MMLPQEKIPPLNPHDLHQHHFGNEWKMDVGEFHQLFHINRIEDVVKKIKFPLPPHRKTVYDFFFLEQGNSIRSKGLYRCEFGANTFFFLPAYQISTHEYVSPDVKGYFCHFDASIFSKLFPTGKWLEDFSFWHFTGEPLVPVQEAMTARVMFLLQTLLDEYTARPSLNSNLIAAYLLTLFTELSTVQPPMQTAKNAALHITEKYKNLLSQHIYQTKRVADYASMLAITADHLNKCVKTTIGKTSQDLLADMMILEAKVLLKQTNLSINEIAFKFSETNPSDFARFFKSKTQYSPKDYRKEVV